MSTTNNRNRMRGKNFERRAGELLEMYRIPYSGSSELFGLGDIRDHMDKMLARYMGECKTMTPRSAKEVNYIIQEKWLVGKMSVVDRAKKEGNKMPFLIFTKKGSPKSFVTIRDIDFKMLIDALDILRHQGILTDTIDVDENRKRIDAYREAHGIARYKGEQTESDESLDDEA